MKWITVTLPDRERARICAEQIIYYRNAQSHEADQGTTKIMHQAGFLFVMESMAELDCKLDPL